MEYIHINFHIQIYICFSVSRLYCFTIIFPNSIYLTAILGCYSFSLSTNILIYFFFFASTRYPFLFKNMLKTWCPMKPEAGWRKPTDAALQAEKCIRNQPTCILCSPRLSQGRWASGQEAPRDLATIDRAHWMERSKTGEGEAKKGDQTPRAKGGTPSTWQPAPTLDMSLWVSTSTTRWAGSLMGGDRHFHPPALHFFILFSTSICRLMTI